MPKEYRLTKAGIAELKHELEELKGRRGSIAERLKAAKAEGDLSENADYTAVLEEQEYVEGRINKLEEILLNAAVIEGNGDKSIVGLGDTVELKSNGQTFTYTVVGSLESDPGSGKISEESPIGKALLGAKTGDKVEINIPSGNFECRITKIS